MGSMKLTVQVLGSSQEITVHHESKRVWVAKGEYLGTCLETKGVDAFSAAKQWQEVARYAGTVKPIRML